MFEIDYATRLISRFKLFVSLFVNKLLRNSKQRLTCQRGFTLIEIMVGVLILSIIMAITIPNLRASGDKAQIAACGADQQLIRNALDSYWIENHTYPTGTTDAILNTLVTGKYLNSIPKEPAGDHFLITIPTDATDTDPIVSCSKHGQLGNN